MVMKKPSKKIQNPLSSPGGGVRGGSSGGGGGRVGRTPKVAPAPKVKLKPEPSTMKLVPSKRSLFGPEEAAAGNRRILDARNRTNTATPRAEKRALNAANKTTKTKSADAARKQSFDRAAKAVEIRNSKIMQGKTVKELNDSMKFARKNSLRFNADGSKITPRQENKYNKNFISGKFPGNWGVPPKKTGRGK